jgi:hypothetical protein
MALAAPSSATVFDLGTLNLDLGTTPIGNVSNGSIDGKSWRKNFSISPVTVNTGDVILGKVRFDNMQHLEMIDNGSGFLNGLGVERVRSLLLSSVTTSGNMTFEMDFQDVSGNLLVNPFLATGFSSGGGLTTITDVNLTEAFDSFMFHGFDFRFTMNSVTANTEFTSAFFELMSDDIVVGDWGEVSEPATLAIFGLCLAGLGLARRKRSA